MTSWLIILLFASVVVAVGYWWRKYSLACPAGLSWLVENPYMNAVAGPALLFERMQLEAGMRLLDVGAGPGRLAIPAAKRVGKTGEVVALDIQQQMLARLKNRVEQQGLTNLRLVHAGAGEGKVQTDYFDRALLVTVLGEIANKEAALSEIYRSLKSGGLLSITEVIPDPHYNRKTRVRRLCQAAGFTETASYGNWLAYTINFVKE